jgi:hypothetical protein
MMYHNLLNAVPVRWLVAAILVTLFTIFLLATIGIPGTLLVAFLAGLKILSLRVVE